MTQAAMKPPREDIAAMLYSALEEPIGLLLATSDTARARQVLYQTRVALGDPELARLQFRLVDLGDGPQIAIVKGERLPSAPEYKSMAQAQSPDLGELDL